MLDSSTARSLAIVIFLLLVPPAPHLVQAQTLTAAALPSETVPEFTPSTPVTTTTTTTTMTKTWDWTTISIAQLMTQTSAPFCTNVADPDHGVDDYCYCSNGLTKTPIPLTGQPASDYQPWVSLLPLKRP
ncbi:hypothetical protein B0H63DRAFT_522236 [Podospora didyma]|uniref:Uncharacterized protein n=1 Tax=Podospora didyma TaxID=330526 RepID=A0AAE0NNN7_9PEZI|nr:hypothetical protein B0H63DRAFT_522236 [Podospora didyma]